MVNPFIELVNQNGKKYAEAVKNSKGSNRYDKCKGCSYVNKDCPERCKKPA